ncbi:hypothetical protein [Streptomyces sp. 6N223]|uniref:hypothetical protein n=1 Tax=Streptomyces sp. 6N223 TaxID=3457412 RepID=UPI003FCEEC74
MPWHFDLLTGGAGGAARAYCCTYQLARDFAAILRRQDGHRLTAKLTQAGQSEIKELHVFRLQTSAVPHGQDCLRGIGRRQRNHLRFKIVRQGKSLRSLREERL